MKLPVIGWIMLAALLAPCGPALAQRAQAWSELRCAEIPLAYEGIARCQMRDSGAGHSALHGRSVEYLARGGPAGAANGRELILWLLWFLDDWVYQPYGPALAESIIRTHIQPALTAGAARWSALERFGSTAFLTFEAKGKQCIGFDHGGPLRRPDKVDAPGHPWLLRGIVCERRASRFEQHELEEILRHVRLRKGGYVDAFGTGWGEAASSPAEAADAAPIAVAATASAPRRELAAPLALAWEDVAPLAAGSIAFADESRTGGTMTFVIPETRIRCTGLLKHLAGGPDTTELPSGTWAVSCPRGDAASGTWRAETEASGRGEGRDALGRRVSIRFGG